MQLIRSYLFIIALVCAFLLQAHDTSSTRIVSPAIMPKPLQGRISRRALLTVQAENGQQLALNIKDLDKIRSPFLNHMGLAQEIFKI